MSSLNAKENIRRLQESLYAGSWNESDDDNLLSILTDISSHMQRRVECVSSSITSVGSRVSTIESSIQNTFVELSLERHNRFIVNKVEEFKDSETKEEMTSSSPDQAMLEDKALQYGLRALSLFSDPKNNDLENETCYYYENVDRDEFNHAPLPYIIGSRPFLQSDFAGLQERPSEPLHNQDNRSQLKLQEATEDDLTQQFRNETDHSLNLQNNPVSTDRSLTTASFMTDIMSDLINDEENSSEKNDLFG